MIIIYSSNSHISPVVWVLISLAGSVTLTALLFLVRGRRWRRRP